MSDNKYTDEFFKNYEQRYMRTEPAPKPVAPKAQKRKKKIIRNRIFVAVMSLTIVSAITLGIILITPPKDKNVVDGVDNTVSTVKKPKLPTLPIFNDQTVELGTKIESEHAIFINVTDNIVVASKNSDARVYPASLTKVLTLLVAVENIKNLDDTFEMTYEITDPPYNAGASMAGFLAGEVITVKDLLYGAILPSGAEATAAIAIYVAGSESKFAELMNEKARKLGITNANFTNTSGLHNNNHYCTVMDMAVVLRAAMKNDICREILSTYQYTTTFTEQHPEGILLTSTLFGRMRGDEPEGAEIKGGKTGFTSEAGNCIASFGVSDSGKEYIFVTTKAKGLWKAVYDHINTYTAYAK